MKIKNTCGKIINFGTLTLLPNEIGVVPKEFENNPVLEAFVERDNITILEDVVAPANEEREVSVPADLETLKKPELIALCKELGAKVEDTDTKAMLIEKIKEATAE